MNMRRLSLLTVVIVSAFVHFSARADWLTNGNVVHSPHNPWQNLLDLAPDNRGGAFVVYSNGGGDAYLDHFTAGGNLAPGFPPSLMASPASRGDHYSVDPIAVVSDGGSDCYVLTFASVPCRAGAHCNTAGQIFISRQGPDGAVVPGWPDQGVAVEIPFVSRAIRGSVCAVSDGSRGVFVAWTSPPPPPYSEAPNRLFVQSVGPDGTRRWGDDGIELGPEWSHHVSPAILPDGHGGAFVLWGGRKSTTDPAQIVIQHLDPERSSADGNDVVVVSSGSYHAITKVTVVPIDGAGVLVGWSAAISPSRQGVFVRGVSKNGLPLGKDDVRLADVDADQDQLCMAPAHGGDAFVAWRDTRSGSASAIYAQKLTREGKAAWDPSGVAIATGAYAKDSPVIAEDGAGGCYVAWADLRPDGELFATRLDRRGFRERGWPENGALVSQWPLGDWGWNPYPGSPARELEIIATGRGEAILGWVDSRGPIDQTVVGPIEEAVVTLLMRDGPAAAGNGSSGRRSETARPTAQSNQVVANGLEIERVAPNPVRDHLLVHFAASPAEDAELSIHDLAGRSVASIQVRGTSGRQEVQVSTRELKPGVYWLRLSQGTRVERTRIVVVK